MRHRYVRNASDLPDHDLILELRGRFACIAFHVRHYVHRDAHIVIVGELAGGGSPIAHAKSVAREVTELVIPPEREFHMITYAPQPPESGEPHFHEVTFEVEDYVKRPSAAVFRGPRVAFSCFEARDLPSVEELVGRPVLTFPYGFYTRSLAEATNGQPAKRLFDLLIEAGLACPAHGPSPYGEYCGVDPRCEKEPNRRARVWQAPYEPRRRSTGGAYLAVATDHAAHIEFELEGYRRPIPVFGFAGPDVAWGYGGSGPEEGATSILTDYLGFLPRPQLRARFETEVVSHLPADKFTLPVSELDTWFDQANRNLTRGLVVVASPASCDWPAGQASGMAVWIANGLLEAGFDVYEPGCNAGIPSWKRTDRRLQGMAHASLLSALDAASMVVIPHDGEALVPGVESATALGYVLQHPRLPAVIAYYRAQERDFVRESEFGVMAAKVGNTLPRDTSAVVAAVDRACAAYECLQVGAGMIR